MQSILTSYNKKTQDMVLSRALMFYIQMTRFIGLF